MNSPALLHFYWSNMHTDLVYIKTFSNFKAIGYVHAETFGRLRWICINWMIKMRFLNLNYFWGINWQAREIFYKWKIEAIWSWYEHGWCVRFRFWTFFHEKFRAIVLSPPLLKKRAIVSDLLFYVGAYLKHKQILPSFNNVISESQKKDNIYWWCQNFWDPKYQMKCSSVCEIDIALKSFWNKKFIKKRNECALNIRQQSFDGVYDERRDQGGRSTTLMLFIPFNAET